jgi:hypothetical protein
MVRNNTEAKRVQDPIVNPWAVIVCQLSDNRVGPTAPLQRYQKLFTAAGEGTYNIIKYFNDVSHGTLDLSGSQLFGSDPQNPIIINYTLAEYQDSTVDPGTRRNRLIANAKKAALDIGVPLNQFYGVVYSCLIVAFKGIS